jgi:perosamine synthetase
MSIMFSDIFAFIKEQYPHKKSIALHEPCLDEQDKKFVANCIDSTFVSSVGEYVNRFEKMICDFTGVSHAIATVNGTAALHVALKVVGVESGDLVITQPLTFVATCNAIRYCGADPVFIDVDRGNMGLCPKSLKKYLETNTEQKNSGLYHKKSGRKIAAVVPMHTFGHACQIDEMASLCEAYNLPLVEDAAEALGSQYGDQSLGVFGKCGVFSFNGNKIITTGGGGMIITNDSNLAQKLRHLTTTAKVPHAYEFIHDEVGFNYRLPNLNAALGCAQMEKLPQMLKRKRELAQDYAQFFSNIKIRFISEPQNSKSNYWLNAIILDDRVQREAFLQASQTAAVMTRPIWTLMNNLAMFKDCEKTELPNAQWLADRVVNLPSGLAGIKP